MHTFSLSLLFTMNFFCRTPSATMTRRTEEIQRRQKEVPRKRQRGEASSHAQQHPPQHPGLHPLLQFQAPAFLTRLERLLKKPFEHSRFIDWPVLQQIGLDQQVRELVTFGSWDRFFDIEEPAYQELTLEFLTTFSLNKRSLSWSMPNIEFQIGGERFHRSYTQFSIDCGFYTKEFTQTDAYRELQVDWPSNFNDQQYWRSISREMEYAPTTSKASRLCHPELRYVHKLLVHTITGRRESTGVVSRRDLFYIYSMREKVAIHLGHAWAWYLNSQASRPRAGGVCCGPYITRLARNLGLFNRLPPLTIASKMKPIDMDTLRSMGMVERRQGPGGPTYVLTGTPPPATEAESERDRSPAPPPQDQYPAIPSHSNVGRLSSQILPMLRRTVALQQAHSSRLIRLERQSAWIEDTLTRLCAHLGVPTLPNVRAVDSTTSGPEEPSRSGPISEEPSTEPQSTPPVDPEPPVADE